MCSLSLQACKSQVNEALTPAPYPIPINKYSGKPFLEKTLNRFVLTINRWWTDIANQKTAQFTHGAICKGLVKHKRFDEIRTVITNPKLINATQAFVKRLEADSSVVPPLDRSLVKATEIFISAFLITAAPLDTLDILHEGELELLRIAENLVNSYEKILRLLRTEGNFADIALATKEFRDCRQLYFEAFAKRQPRHHEQMQSQPISTYVKFEITKNRLNHSVLTRKERTLFNSIVQSQAALKRSIIAFSGNKGLDQLNKQLEALALEHNQQFNLLCYTALETDYELIRNPNFRFPHKSDEAANELFTQTTAIVSKDPIDARPIITCLLAFRLELSKLFPNDKQRLAYLWKELNAEHLEEVVPKFGETDTFFAVFNAIFYFLRPIVDAKSKAEMDTWKTIIVNQIADGTNPYTLLPEIFRGLKIKIDRAQVDLMNALLNGNREYWRAEAKKHMKEHFSKSVALNELHLDNTDRWVRGKFAKGCTSKLSREMLRSNGMAGHVLIAALVDTVQSSTKLKKKDCPETLLLDRVSLNALQGKLFQFKKQIVVLEMFKYLAFQKKLPLASDAPEKLLQKIQGVNNSASKLKYPLLATMIKACADPKDRVHKLVSARISEALKYFLYKGYLPEEFGTHHIYGLFPFQKLGAQLYDLATANFSIHEERYSSQIETHLCDNLFNRLKKTQKYNPATMDLLFFGEGSALKEVHKKIVKLSQVATALTVIRLQLWHSNETLWENNANLPQSDLITDVEMSNLIDTHEIKRLISANDTTRKTMYQTMEFLLDQVLANRGACVEIGVLTHTKKILKEISFSKNRGNIDFQMRIVEMITSKKSTDGVGNTPIYTTLKYFIDDLNELKIQLQAVIKKTLTTINDAQEKPLAHKPIWQMRTGLGVR